MSEQSPVRGFATVAAQAKTLNRREAQVVRMIARVPYLNSVPFFRGLPLGTPYGLVDCMPRELGARAAAGEIVAGPLPVIDVFRLEQTFEPLGRVGIAVRGRAHSALLFARQPIRQLDGAVIAVTEESSTTACLLRLLLEQRYRVIPAAYERGQRPDAEALLLIGDEALRFKYTNTRYPFEIDVGFEWWLWQHLPFVFAVWAVRKDAAAQEKRQIEAALMRSLTMNLGELGVVAQEASQRLGLPAHELEQYLASFVYRLGPSEGEGMQRFRELVDEHHLL